MLTEGSEPPLWSPKGSERTMALGRSQGREQRVWRLQVKVWAVAAVSISLLAACFIASSLVAHRASTLCGKIDKRLSTLQEYQDRHLNLSCFIEGKETEEDWSCCPALWSPFQSHCYFISPEMQPWNESRKNCSGMGADLMAINSKDEQTIHEKMNDCGTRTKAIAFIAHIAGIGMTSEPDSLTSGTVLAHTETRAVHEKEFIIKHLMKESAYYVGLSDPAGQRRWQWVDQTPYDAAVTFWHPGEPNNRDERCVTIHFRTSSKQWGWNDVHCDLLQKSVCKMTKIYL